MDFGFPFMKVEYGIFLTTLYGHCEDPKIEDVRSFYPHVTDMAIISVTVLEDIAMLLKLQFSGNMRTRPEPELREGVILKILKNRNYDSQKEFFIQTVLDNNFKIIKYKNNNLTNCPKA